ncbi:hypothetical protein ACM66B_002937 [Microbotryomycetes sp. NB124-2]
MWQAVLDSPAEKQAFMSLLDEYFQQRQNSFSGSSSSVASTAPPPSSQHQARPPPVTAHTRPAGLTTSSNAPPASSAPSPASVSLANAALKQPALTSSALRASGMSPAAASVAARFGAQHSEKLAPHVAAGVQSRFQQAGGEREMPPKGPRAPSGLESTAAKSFGKALLTAKAPMSKEEAAKKKFTESLAVNTPTSMRAASPAAPPPMRGASWKAQQGLGQAMALYDFEGAETSDLPVAEGETVTVVEHVSDDWWKCRNTAGAEGLVPSSYLQAQ